MLQNRREQVIFVTKDSDYILKLTDDQIKSGEEIEKYIVSEVVMRHINWMVDKDC